MTNVPKSRDIRHKAILSSVVIPMTTQEIADLLGLSYFTVNRDLKELLRLNQVAPDISTGLNGANKYISKVTRPVPVFYNTFTAKENTISEYVGNHANNKFGFPVSAHAIRRVFDMMIELMEMARALNEGAVSEREASTVLKAYKNDLLRAKGLISSVETLIDQMLSNPILWKASELSTAVADGTFPMNIREVYEDLLQERNRNE